MTSIFLNFVAFFRKVKLKFHQYILNVRLKSRHYKNLIFLRHKIFIEIYYENFHSFEKSHNMYST